LPEDFIETLEGAYKGQMRERFLLGNWGGFEGLVYPQYDPTVHMLAELDLINYFLHLQSIGFAPEIIEAYDHGIAKPSCYTNAFTDYLGNTFVFDGWYQAELTLEEIANKIKEKRKRLQELFGVDVSENAIFADPAIFRRTTGNTKTVGVAVSGLFAELGIRCTRANNDIISGIAKVQSYLAIDTKYYHPINKTLESPRLFFCSELNFIDQEIVDYYWKKDQQGQYEDTPKDRDDHAMDNIKYLLSRRPQIAKFVRRRESLPPSRRKWTEVETQAQDRRQHRYG
jgi:hypothetical protein